MVWLGTPCTAWSEARRSETTPTSRRCAAFTARVLERCAVLGLHVVLENPATSKLFSAGPIRRALSRFGTGGRFIEFDMCGFGAAWRKRTKVWTTLEYAGCLARRCPDPSTTHAVLAGSVYLSGVRWRWRSKFASSYPRQLCLSVAGVLSYAAPPRTWRRAGEPELDRGWERSLAFTVHSAAPGRLLEAPELPEQDRLGWEHSTRS